MDERDLDALMAAIERIRLGHHPVSATFMRTIADAIAALRARAEQAEAALRSFVKCDERDHANPAAYWKAMRKPIQAARAAIDRARSQGGDRG